MQYCLPQFVRCEPAKYEVAKWTRPCDRHFSFIFSSLPLSAISCSAYLWVSGHLLCIKNGVKSVVIKMAKRITQWIIPFTVLSSLEDKQHEVGLLGLDHPKLGRSLILLLMEIFWFNTLQHFWSGVGRPSLLGLFQYFLMPSLFFSIF